MRNNTIDGNTRHFDNKIDRSGLANLEDIEIGDVKPPSEMLHSLRGSRCDRVGYTSFFDRFLFPLAFECGVFGDEPVAGSAQTKT